MVCSDAPAAVGDLVGRPSILSTRLVTERIERKRRRYNFALVSLGFSALYYYNGKIWRSQTADFLGDKARSFP